MVKPYALMFEELYTLFNYELNEILKLTEFGTAVLSIFHTESKSATRFAI